MEVGSEITIMAEFLEWLVLSEGSDTIDCSTNGFFKSTFILNSFPNEYRYLVPL